jgi:hypothetical protein
LALIPECLDAVVDDRLVLERLFQQAEVFCELRPLGFLRTSP